MKKLMLIIFLITLMISCDSNNKNNLRVEYYSQISENVFHEYSGRYKLNEAKLDLVTSYYKFYYDEKDSPVKIIYFNNDTTAYSLKMNCCKLIVEYIKDEEYNINIKKHIKYFTLDTLCNEDSCAIIWDYSLDKQERPISLVQYDGKRKGEEIYINNDICDGIDNIKKIKYEYNDQNNIQIIKRLDGNYMLVSNIMKNKYDDNGKLLETATYSKHDKKSCTTRYFRTTSHDYWLFSWEFHKISYKYDDIGNIIEKRYYNENNQLIDSNIAIEKYFYDNLGNLIDVEYYNNKDERIYY